MKLTFLGATNTVTGSKYLLEHNQQTYLIDCGLYQGVKYLRERNWIVPPISVSKLNAVILTHAHIDHSGYLPALVKNGFTGPVFCTEGTHELCKILLPDAGFLQEEDARFANKYSFSKHKPALPLYTEKDAEHSLKQFRSCAYHSPLALPGDLQLSFSPTGHILGASAVQLTSASTNTTLTFTGDLGRYQDLMMYDPEPINTTDYLVTESTYGDRLHDPIDALDVLQKIITKTTNRGGIVLIPAFAVGRAQLILHLVAELIEKNRINKIPVFLNSPMAISATEIYQRFHHELKLTATDCSRIDQYTHYVKTVAESIDLNTRQFPCVIISASGMASGGRVLHHLKAICGNYRNSIVFVGFQAPGTRGESMINGVDQVKIHGKYYPIKAEIHHLDNFSAHGDYKDILAWLKMIKSPPKCTFITHGEPAAADSLRLKIKDQLGWKCCVPSYRDSIELK
ncbi:MBL fold metallo-hydrolase [Zooshikella marina]|uniref:MBL fold metallo-hydrolase RNA specificity domain-containing protein n=1 Tax=Zooshikella ganghwensis TaxID=202772 RepID=UPI001BAF9372|nr:MBL fold metallo-hydrolase [Zooshikella ganghwensis]MBU2707147.1 MBL fold metallo-hydrolase [Zooshikella ganghwensis]